MRRRRTWVLLSLLLMLTACQTSLSARNAAPTPTPTPTMESIAVQWAEAVTAGDHAALATMMNGANNILYAAWRGRTEEFRQAGRLQAYSIGTPVAAGTSTNVEIRWTGSGEPMCTTIQVAPDRTVSIVSDLYVCKGQ